MQGTNTIIELQLHMKRAKYLGGFRAGFFLAACVIWETTWLCSQVKTRHRLCCYVRFLVFRYSSRERRGLGTGFPSYSVRTQHRALQQSPLTMKSETLLGFYRKKRTISPMRLMVISMRQHSLLF